MVLLKLYVMKLLANAARGRRDVGLYSDVDSGNEVAEHFDWRALINVRIGYR